MDKYYTGVDKIAKNITYNIGPFFPPVTLYEI